MQGLGFGNWLGLFWELIGGHFKNRLNVYTGKQTFTELGCQDFFIDTPDEYGNLIMNPQKVWINIEQPGSSHAEINTGSLHRVEDGVLLTLNLKAVPCKVTWFILM